MREIKYKTFSRRTHNKNLRKDRPSSCIRKPKVNLLGGDLEIALRQKNDNQDDKRDVTDTDTQNETQVDRNSIRYKEGQDEIF